MTSKCEVLKDLAKKHDGIKEILAKECPKTSEKVSEVSEIEEIEEESKKGD